MMKNKKYGVICVCHEYNIHKRYVNYVDNMYVLFDSKEQAQKEIDKAIDDEIDTLNCPEKLEVIDPTTPHYYPTRDNMVCFGFFEEDGTENRQEIISHYLILEFEV